jgi:acylphosphatase
MVRYTINFSGRVQGVGFRATTRDVADGFAVTGWVRNEPDGSVLCVAEGEQAELDRFVHAIKQMMSTFIRDARITTTPATGEFVGYNIR